MAKKLDEATKLLIDSLPESLNERAEHGTFQRKMRKMHRRDAQRHIFIIQ